MNLRTGTIPTFAKAHASVVSVVVSVNHAPRGV